MQVSSLLEAKFAELLERLPLQASRGSLDGTTAGAASTADLLCG